jgi:2-iminoacetate synthase
LVLDVGVSQLSGGSRTSVGGYADEQDVENVEDSAQFDISDDRTLDEIVGWLLELGYVPSFCTACYREGRTGDRFMSLAKRGLIGDCCAPNALMTLAEYLEDYASPNVKLLGKNMIARQTQIIPSEKIRRITEERMRDIAQGKRDFRF